MSVGLVLEGGGMRGIYTAGVLEYFMRKEIKIPYVVAVSAGASNGISYTSGQQNRNFKVLSKYVNDKKYLSLKNLMKIGCVFDFDFIIDEIGRRIEPVDLTSFIGSDIRFITGVTDILTGEAVYYEKEEYLNSFDCLRASCSQPFLSQIVNYKERELLDGGIADPIPIRKSIEDGNDKNIIVLTRENGYQKKKEYRKSLCKQVYGDYPQLYELLISRSKEYNKTLEFCHELEQSGKAIIIRPDEKLPVGRLERSKEKLTKAYRLGIHDAKKKRSIIEEFIREGV